MSANLENSAVAKGLENVSFHSNPKERQCQRIFTLLHKYTHVPHQESNWRRQWQRMFRQRYDYTYVICQQGQAANSSSQASTVQEPKTSRCTSWIQKMQRIQRSNCQHPFDHKKSRRIPKKTLPKNLKYNVTLYLHYFASM